MKQKSLIQLTVLLLCLCILPSVNAQRRQIIRGSQPQINPGPASTDVSGQLEELYQKKDFPKVVEEANKVLQTDPNNHVALYFRGAARVDYGTQIGSNKIVRKGIEDAREAVAKSQRKVASYYIPYLFGMTSLSTMENKKEFAETAVSIATSVLQNPKIQGETRANIYFQRGNTNLTLNKLDDATTDFQSAIRLAPKHLAAYSSLAEAYVRKGDKQKALGAFDQMILLFPENPLSYNNRGMYYQQVNDYDKAIQDFTKTIELNPNYIYAYTNRGFTYLEKGDLAEAEKDFSQSLRLNPQQPVIFNMRGSSRLGQGKLNEAIADHEQSIKLDPQNPISYANLGFTCFYSALYDKSEGAFQKSLELDPSQKFLVPWLYWIQVQKGAADTEAGMKLAKESLEQEPGKRDWVDFLILKMAGKITDQELLSAVTEAKGEAQAAQRCEAQFFLGMISMQENDFQNARKHFQASLDTKAVHLSAYQGAFLALNHPNSELRQ